MKKNFLAALLLSAALALAGCNTVQGFGQDLKKGAEHVGAALGKAGDKIPVDYCERRFVKKPPKAKAGFVIYTDFQTALATPDRHEKEEIL